MTERFSVYDTKESQVSEMNNKDMYRAESLGSESEFGVPWQPEAEEVGRMRARPIRSQRPRPMLRRPPKPPQRPIPRRRRPPWLIDSRYPLITEPEPGSRGSEYVSWVQTMLNQTLNLQLPVDGVLTVQTRSAIRSFQEKNGLPVTGIVGPDTERALIAARNGQSPGASSTKPDEPGMTAPPQTAATPTEPGKMAPAEPVPTSPAAEFDRVFNEVFENERYQTLLEPADTLEQFIGSEHRDIGDLASGRTLTTIVYGERGERLTFGEMVALAGDHFETYNEMVDLTGTAAGRAKIAWARWYALDLKKQNVREPKADKNYVMERYYVLASRNWSHFSAGGDAWSHYVSWHSKAIADAFQSGQEGSESVWRRALTKEAFGDHFLTDMFSAGHVRVPRIAIRDWYAQHIPGDRLLRYMARFLYDRLPLPWYAHIFSGRAKDQIRENIVRFGGAAIRTVSVGDIVGVALHDYDGQGLRVVSDVDPDGKKRQGGFPWLAVGDARLGKSRAGSTTKLMATAAVITSLRDLERVRGVGRKLAGQQLSSPQQASAIKQALGGKYHPVFAARAFVPREDPRPRADGQNVPLPDSKSAKSPLEWRWGQLGDITYQIVDDAVKNRIAQELTDRLPSVQDKDQKRVLGLFADHLRSEGIRALEKAVGQKAR